MLIPEIKNPKLKEIIITNPITNANPASNNFSICALIDIIVALYLLLIEKLFR